MVANLQKKIIERSTDFGQTKVEMAGLPYGSKPELACMAILNETTVFATGGGKVYSGGGKYRAK